MLLLVLGVGGYFGTAEVLLHLPRNAGADPTTGSIDVYFVSNGVHVDVWVPARRAGMHWDEWLPPEVPLAARGFAAFGWGDEGFYTEVPTWGDLTFPVAARAILLPSDTAMRVHARTGKPVPGDHVHRVRLDDAEYTSLMDFIKGTFELDEDGRPILLDHPGYTDRDRFFRARGSYSLFRTCNQWTVGALAAAGQTATRWAPMERHAR